MCKAVEAAETTDAGQRQAQWFDLWAVSMRAACHQAEATGLGARSFEAWMEFVRSQPAAQR